MPCAASSFFRLPKKASMYCRRSSRFSSSSLAMRRYSSGFWWRKPKSSSCHLSCHTPRRLASGAKISSVSLAAARFSGLSGTLPRNCMVRVRSASAISTTRMSDTIASSILRMVSACAARSSGEASASTRAKWVSLRTSSMPRTSVHTVLPQVSTSASSHCGQWRGISASTVAATASGSRSICAAVSAAAKRCASRGSPKEVCASAG